MSNVGHSTIASLIDFRDAAARSIVEGEIQVDKRFPNLDYLYGPYYPEGTEGEEGYKSAKQVAFEKLQEKSKMGNDGLILMKTVGIVEDGVAREYWFKEKCETIDDLVPKSSGTEGLSGLISVNYDYNQLRIKGKDSENDAWFVPMQALENTVPSIKDTDLVIVSGKASFPIVYDKNAVLYISDTDEDSYAISDGTYEIDTQYTDSKRNTKITKELYVKVEKYGIITEASPNPITLTVSPKINLPDMVVKDTSTTAGFAEENTLTIKKALSLSGNAITTYKNPSGTEQTLTADLDISLKPDTDSDGRPKPTTFNAGAYQVTGTDNDTGVATPYETTVKSSPKIILGQMPAYWGFSTKESMNSRKEIEDECTAQSWGMAKVFDLRDKSFGTDGDYTCPSNSIGGYLWICCNTAITQLSLKQLKSNTQDMCFIQDMGSIASLPGYHLYRSEGKLQSNVTSFYIKA